MSRRIITAVDAAIIDHLRGRSVPPEGQNGVRHMAPNAEDAPPTKSDDYSSQLIKLIPAEVVAVFLTIDAIIKSSNDAFPHIAYWVIFVLLVAGTYLYMLWVAKLPPLPKPRVQAVLATVSFIVWVFAIGGPFSYSHPSWYMPIYGAILLPLYTFFGPLFLAIAAGKT
jgi:hypothetical protein